MPAPLVYGLHDMEGYRNRTVQSVGIQIVEEAVAQWAMFYSGVTNRFLDTVLARNPVWNTTPVTRTRLPFMVDMQLVDEDGVADPVQNYLTYDIGLPLQRREIAAGWTWERRQVLTINDLNDWLYTVMTADSYSFRTAAKRALFYNAGWNFYSVEEDANMPSTIPIVPLANGDAQTYPRRNGTIATANHYTAQAAQVANGTDPFPTIFDTMTRYAMGAGLVRPRLVSFVNGSGLVAGIRGLTDFEVWLPQRFITPGIGTTTVSDAIENELYFGSRVLGEHSTGIVVVQWDDLPNNYILTIDFDQMPLGMREKAEPGLQGLIGLNGILSHYGNEETTRVRRIMGVSVVNRTAAHVHLVAAGDTTYVVPTGYVPTV